jgi:hypothetical protein
LDLRRKQQNLAYEAWGLPLTLVSFFGSLAEAAKSCLRGVSAAFGLGRFHQVFGGGSKILLLEACLLPLALVGFIGSSAEAANSCLRGVVAAFDLGWFLRVFGRGSRFQLASFISCLSIW